MNILQSKTRVLEKGNRIKSQSNDSGVTGIGDSINASLGCSNLLAFISYVLAMLEGTLALRLRRK